MAYTPKPGTYATTRLGGKAYVSSILDPNPFHEGSPKFPVCGFVEGDFALSNPRAWTAEGSFYGDRECELDLVADWAEPRTGEYWVAISCWNANPDMLLSQVFWDINTLFRTLKDTPSTKILSVKKHTWKEGTRDDLTV